LRSSERRYSSTAGNSLSVSDWRARAARTATTEELWVCISSICSTVSSIITHSVPRIDKGFPLSRPAESPIFDARTTTEGMDGFCRDDRAVTESMGSSSSSG